MFFARRRRQRRRIRPNRKEAASAPKSRRRESARDNRSICPCICSNHPHPLSFLRPSFARLAIMHRQPSLTRVLILFPRKEFWSHCAEARERERQSEREIFGMRLGLETSRGYSRFFVFFRRDFPSFNSSRRSFDIRNAQNSCREIQEYEDVC